VNAGVRGTWAKRRRATPFTARMAPEHGRSLAPVNGCLYRLAELKPIRLACRDEPTLVPALGKLAGLLEAVSAPTRRKTRRSTCRPCRLESARSDRPRRPLEGDCARLGICPAPSASRLRGSLLSACLLLPPSSAGFYNCPVVRDGFEAEARGWTVIDRHGRLRRPDWRLDRRLLRMLPGQTRAGQTRAASGDAHKAPEWPRLRRTSKKPRLGPRTRSQARASVLCRWHERQVWAARGERRTAGTVGFEAFRVVGPGTSRPRNKAAKIVGRCWAHGDGKCCDSAEPIDGKCGQIRRTGFVAKL
jgi:hypothetical protein